MSELINVEKPAYLQKKEGEKSLGTELFDQYATLSYAKVVQPMSKEPLKPLFKDGDLVLTPELIKISSLDEYITIVPIFFYPYFVIHNPLGVQPFIVEKTFDPESEIAIKCRKRNQSDRQFPCPGHPGEVCEYSEHLAFVCVILNISDIRKKLVQFDFCRGEWKYGKNFTSLIDSRDTDIFANKFQLKTTIHKGGGYAWPGIHISNPDNKDRYVDEAQCSQYKKIYESFVSFYISGELSIDTDNQSFETSKSEFS